MQRLAADTETIAGNEDAMRKQFDRIKEAAARDPSPPWGVRKRRLESLLTLLHDNGDRFGEAISADFGHRSRQETQLLELFPSLEAARHALSHGAEWMRQRRVQQALVARQGRDQ